MPEKILGIETAYEQCVVVLSHENSVSLLREEEPRQHSRRLIGMADSLLASAEIDPTAIDLLVWSAGPGSFTGLRAAASFCQALSWAHAIPVIALSTLHIVAQAAVIQNKLPDESVIAVALDARMGDIYFGLYQCRSHRLDSLVKDQLLPAYAGSVPALPKAVNGLFLAGDAWELPGLISVEGERVVTGVAIPQAMVSLAAESQHADREKNPTVIAPYYLRSASHWKKVTRPLA